MCAHLAGQAQAGQWVDSGSLDRYWIAVGRIGPWTFLWEDNGYDGSLPAAQSLANLGWPAVLA